MAKKHAQSSLPKLTPMTLAHLWLLQAVDHPLIKADQQKDDVAAFQTIGRDTAAGLYIFVDPEAALIALQQGRDTFDREAMKLAARIKPGEMARLGEELSKAISQGMA